MRSIIDTPSARLSLHPFAINGNDQSLAGILLIELFVPEDVLMASLSDWTNGRAGSVHTVNCRVEALDDFIEKNNLPWPDFI